VKIELLSPAKDYECGKAAIDCGADALYIGAEKFSARASASNTVDQIARLAEYAHRFYARVYVALNTIIYDREIEALRALVENLYHAGADALIVQDMALLEMELPPIALHASTQTHITTPERAKFLSDAGFSRLVVARELSPDRIAAIHAASDAEIECFIHGALCVSYSGRCFLSNAIGGRSGNRGNARRPCRRQWELLDADMRQLAKGHLLSLKDMNRTEYIGSLIDAGVTSFKIEGRLKDAAYVRNVTAHYRRVIDAHLADRSLARSSSGISHPAFEPAPEKSFNRGFTPYFLTQSRDDVSSHATPKSLGAPVGTVIEVKGRGVRLDSDILQNGDGIVFFCNGELCGTNALIDDDGLLVTGNNFEMQRGMVIYRNKDLSFEKSLEKSCPRKIVISAEIAINDSFLSIALRDADGNAAREEYGPFERATDESVAKGIFTEGMRRTGATIYEFELSFKGDYCLFIPPKRVNEIRRTLLDKFEECRKSAYSPPAQKERAHPDNGVTHVDASWGVANRLAEAFYRKCGAQSVEYAPEVNPRAAEDIPLLTSLYCPFREYHLCSKAGERLYLRSGGDLFEVLCSCARSDHAQCGIEIRKHKQR